MAVNNALKTGTILCGRYEIERVIGEGGFGITYYARHLQLGTYVAIKEFFLSDLCLRDQDGKVTYQDITPEKFEKYRKRFHDEARTLCKLSNPHVVHVRDIFDENDTTYIVMDYIAGETLQQKVVREGALQYDVAVNYMAQLCEAVEHIHANHILHRDIKPDNIIITPQNNVVLIDFGSARGFVHDKEQHHTAMLTMGYAPYEQYTANGKKGNYTDIYAIGATFYFLLTGRKPTSATDRMLRDDLQAPHIINPQIPVTASHTIMRALKLKPEDRYQNVAEFKHDLLGETGGGGGGKWKWIIIGVTALLIGIIVGAWLYISKHRHVFRQDACTEFILRSDNPNGINMNAELRPGATPIEWTVNAKGVSINAMGYLQVDSATYEAEPYTLIKVATKFRGKVYEDSILVHLEYITIESEPKPEPEPDPNPILNPPTPPSGDQLIVDGIHVRLREGPGLDYNICGRVNTGTVLTSYGLYNNEWYMVSYKGKTLYINAQFVKPYDSNNNNKYYPPAQPNNKLKVIGTGVRLRTCPNLNCKVRYFVNTGTVLSSHGMSCEPDWYEVEYQGMTLYVHRDYVQPIE